MTLNLEFDTEGVARCTGTGEVTFEETLDTVKRLYADPRFQVPTRILWDLRAGSFDISTEDVSRLSDYVLKNRVEGRGRTAIVAGDDLVFGMSRMYEFMTAESSAEIQVFRDAEAALDWLSENF